MNCDCKDWKESWPQIESAQVMASIHGQQYTGVKFKYCPWCGKELKDSIWKPADLKTNKPIMWEKTTTSEGVKVIMNGRNTSIEEDKAMSSYVKERYYVNSTVIPDTDCQVWKGGKYGLGEDYFIEDDRVRGKYFDVPTSSDEFAKRKENQSPCDTCQNNPLVNRLASGVCFCTLGNWVVY